MRIERREARHTSGRLAGTTHLGRRRARECRVADRVDRLRLRRDRARHRDPSEQHARRVRPEPARERARPGPPDEHDGAVARARPGRPPRRGRQRGLDQAAGRDHADRDQRRAARNAGRGGDRRAAVHVDNGHVHCEGGCDQEELDGSSLGYELIRWRRQNLYFGGASAVERETTAVSQRPATRAAEATGSSCRR